jgi:hypothetical protein
MVKMLCLTVSTGNFNFSKVTVRFKVLHFAYFCGRLVFGIYVQRRTERLLDYIVWVYKFMQIL